MKIIGTIIGISGATIMTFIKGPEIKLTTWFHVHRNDHNVLQRDTISGSKNILGALASLGTQVSNALWLINQVNFNFDLQARLKNCLWVYEFGFLWVI